MPVIVPSIVTSFVASNRPKPWCAQAGADNTMAARAIT